MQATLPTGPAVNFAVTGTANTQAVPGGGVVEITVSGCDVLISCGGSSVISTAADPTDAWQNLFLKDGMCKTHRRLTTVGTHFSVIAYDGVSTGFVQIVPVEGA